MDYFGIREVCDVTLRSLRNVPACNSITGKAIKKGEPVMYFERLKVSNITGNTTTVYATGGRGNTRRLAWDGDKEVTFHIEDALITPTSLSILTAAYMRRRHIVQVPLTAVLPANIIWDLDTQTVTIKLNGTGFDKEKFIDWVRIKVQPSFSDGTPATYGTNDPGNGVVGDPDYVAPATTPTYAVVAGVPAMASGSPVYLTIKPEDVLYDQGVGLIPTDPGYVAPSIAFSHGKIPYGISIVENITIQQANTTKKIFKHEKERVTPNVDGRVDLKFVPTRDSDHPIFIFDVQSDGSIDLVNEIENADGTKVNTGTVGVATGSKIIRHGALYEGNNYIVDYYREVKGNTTSLVITADATSDYYKLEGETLIRREEDGQDVACVITLPKVKPKAAFDIPMSSTGDPSTFAFDFDVFPAATPEYKGCKENVMVIIDIIEDADDSDCVCIFEDEEDNEGDLHGSGGYTHF